MKVSHHLFLLVPLVTLAAPVDAQWSTDALSSGRYQLSSTTVGSKAIFAGGFTALDVGSSVVDIYDFGTDTWTIGSLSAPRGWMAAATVGNKAMFAGGTHGTVPSAVVDIYDDTTGTWSVASISPARYGCAAASLGNNLYVAGGWDIQPSDVIDIYDDSTGTWSIDYLSAPRVDLAVATVGTKIMFGGGWSGGGPSAVVDIYDSSTSSWTIATLSQPRERLGAATVGDKVIFAGGGGTVVGDNDTVDIYDNFTDTWSTTTLTAPREFLGAAAVGSVAIFGGGWNGVAGANSAVVDIYDDITGTWTVSSLSVARWGLTATTVGSKAMFAGGSGNLAISARVDIYEDLSLVTPFGGGGVGFPCPCANTNDGSLLPDLSGCAGAPNPEGCRLLATGDASITADTVVLVADHAKPNTSGLFFKGNDQLLPGVPMGGSNANGLLQCATKIKRFDVVSVVGGVADSSSYTKTLSELSGASAGDTRQYQFWFRTPKASGPCTNPSPGGSNVSNGLSILWGA